MTEIDQQTKIDAVMDWAEETPHFNVEFVEKLQQDLQVKGELSEKQEAALDNIIDKWRVPI